MTSPILVTGATGTVGSCVVRELSRKGASVRAGVHSREKEARLKGPGVEFVEIDYRRKNTIADAVKGVKRLYLLTPFTPDQVELAISLVDAARRAGVEHIVKQSAIGADSKPGITAGRLHRQAEEYIEKSGLASTFIRPNFFMQNFINYFGGSIRTEGRIYLPLGDGKVSYIDARDIGAAAAAVLSSADMGGHNGKAYTLTGPEPLGVADVARLIGAVASKPVSYVNVPEEEARSAMLKAGLPEWNVNALMELHGIAKAGYAARVTGDVRTLTGKDPGDFRKFASDNANAFR